LLWAERNCIDRRHVEEVMTRKRIVTALAGLLLVGCAEADAEPTADPDPEPSLESGTEPGVPPPVTVRFDGRSAELAAWTFCYGNACADGVPPENPVDVGRPAEVYVAFPVPDWTFTAVFQPAGDECGRQHDVPLEPVGDGVFLLRPAGYADTYDVTLAGWGDGEGDLYVTFRWTTPTDGPLPEPTARLAVLADHDGEVDSYGVELMATALS
jgi:hypothetical protein